MEDNAIIIFSKNLDLGAVKTRIGRTLGEEKALEIYKELLEYTESVLNKVSYPRYIFWEREITTSREFFSGNSYIHKVQYGEGLGERMETAFLETLKNHKKVIIIGTDCPYLTGYHLEMAFSSLATNDFCIGPAYDGGYYLLGLKSFSSKWFRNISWSTERVYSETLEKAAEMQLVGFILPTLGDVDTEGDYYKWKEG